MKIAPSLNQTRKTVALKLHHEERQTKASGGVGRGVRAAARFSSFLLPAARVCPATTTRKGQKNETDAEECVREKRSIPQSRHQWCTKKAELAQNCSRYLWQEAHSIKKRKHRLTTEKYVGKLFCVCWFCFVWYWKTPGLLISAILQHVGTAYQQTIRFDDRQSL